jgi:putative ABC transport system permease protein
MLPVREIAMSWRVLLYVLGATGLCTVLFGIAPVLRIARRTPGDVLRDEGRAATGAAHARRWGDLLLVSQVALALALSLGAGLLVRSYLLLRRVDPGFDSRNVLAVGVVLPGIRFDSTRKVLAFYGELEREARALPGVEAAALVSIVPLDGPSWSSQFAIAGREPIDGQVLHREQSPDYQQVMRVPLIRGRFFTAADRQDAPAVVLINQTLAKSYFAGRDPIGQRVAFDRVPDSTSSWRTIVGVVGDERQGSLGESPQPEFLAPYPQEARSGMTLLVRTRNNPVLLAPAVRAIVKRLDPALAISSLRTMEEVRAQSLARDRFLTVLMLSFAGVGLALGLVGVYGVVAQLARRRMREMGIRIALGARAGQVQWLVVRHGVVVTAAGVAAGVAVALLATRVIRPLLYAVAPSDPVTFVAAPVLVLVTAAVASWLPAVRAGRADPCEVLRAD